MNEELLKKLDAIDIEGAGMEDLVPIVGDVAVDVIDRASNLYDTLAKTILVGGDQLFSDEQRSNILAAHAELSSKMMTFNTVLKIVNSLEEAIAATKATDSNS